MLGRWENAMRQIENSTPVLSPYSSIDSFLVNAVALYKTGRMEEAKRIFMEIGPIHFSPLQFAVGHPLSPPDNLLHMELGLKL